MADLKVHIGIPTRDGHIADGQFSALFAAANTQQVASIQIEHGSWITRNFNACFAAALNNRPLVTHFLLLHDDVIPTQPDWLSKLVAISEAKKASVLSVVAPIKTGSGLTSTALDVPLKDYDPKYRVKRLTMTEVFEKYEPTFTDPKLLLNTGMMLIDIRQAWVEGVWFEFIDRIVKDKDGKFQAMGFSEDWLFSRRANALGASLWATREVEVIHQGGGKFGNSSAWGSLKEDA